MRENPLSLLCYVTRLIFSTCLLLIALNSQAGDANLQNKLTQLKAVLQDNVYGIPLHIESRDEDHIMQGDVYGILRHSFPQLRQALTIAAHWCEIAPQHFNIKACTSEPKNNHCQVTFYSGRKFYEEADDVYQLPYRFDLQTDETAYFQTRLSSASGPMGTRDYRIEIEAIPVDATSSFIHFSYAYHYNFFSRLGMSTYLSTLGRSKVGFTVVEKDHGGKPVYVQGVRGIIERNAVRYYFAIQSYLDTADIPADERFTARLNHWFDLTERYPLQLHEMERQAYLESKQLEHQDQLRLQQQIFSTGGGRSSCPDH